MVNAEQLNKRLDELEKTIGAVVPMVAQGAAVIRLVGSLVRGKMTPDQQKTFDQVIAEYDTNAAQLQDAIGRLRAASSSQTAPVGSTAVKSSATAPEGHSEG